MSHYGSRSGNYTGTSPSSNPSSRPPPPSSSLPTHPNPLFPPPSTIHRSTITRIESYGIFLTLPTYKLNALAHVSQLRKERTEDPNDFFDVGDVVYCKIVDVEETNGEDGKIRRRVAGSLKYVDQNNGEDLDPEGTEFEQEKNRRGGGGGGDQTSGLGSGFRHGGASTELGQRLNSQVGLGVGLDPMIAMQSRSIKLKSSGVADFNGYDLVGEGEGEPVHDGGGGGNERRGGEGGETVRGEKQGPRPMGRGRGNTLPSWMTNPGGNVGGGGEGGEGEKKRKRKIEKDEKKKAKKEKKKAKKAAKKEKKKAKKAAKKSAKKAAKKSKKSKSKKSKKPSTSSDEDSGSGSDSSDSESESSNSSGSDTGGSDEPKWNSVEEAKAMLAKLKEMKKRKET
ncbi:hypothetical protein TrCOL_g2898 [Triparma columacea]|uniref:S1 motif domain-containing protein n=1 Tax=Triparma columacea TaxID=722753 RepID=A0A9W7GDW5_9STRA|nr:hypothetical protein TrCOL_g2898 [Triparma columacea]